MYEPTFLKNLLHRRDPDLDRAADRRFIALLNESRSDGERAAIVRSAGLRFRARRRRP